MWEDDGSDFGGQANGDSGESGFDSAGVLDLGNSELMYGTFMDPTVACGSGGWGGRFEMNQLQQHHPHNQYNQHSVQQFSAGHPGEQDEAARAAEGIDASAIHVGIIEDASDERKIFYEQAEAAVAAASMSQSPRSMQQPPQCLLPSVPELASWWGSNASGSQAGTSGGNGGGVGGVGSAVSSSSWTPDVQQLQHQHLHQVQNQQQPSESVSEREFIIVRKAKTSIGWDGSPVAEAAVVYECRICGRQCRWRSSISVHVRTHTGRKPYQCRVCHHRFADSSTRKKHEKKTHGCIIPGNKKAVGFDGQMAAAAAAGLHHQHQPEASPTCHLCFAMLPNESELTKHLYEYHNHLSPADFAAPVGAVSGAPDEVPVLVTPVRRVAARHQEPPIYEHQVSVGGHGVWPEFDDSCQQLQQHQQHQQHQQIGIPLPAVQQSVAREIDQNIGAVDQQPEHQRQHQHQHQHQQQHQQRQLQHQHQQDGQDLLYPYEIGSLGRDLHGIDSILDDSRLTSYNQHLEFDKLDW